MDAQKAGKTNARNYLHLHKDSPRLTVREKIFAAQYENPFEKKGPAFNLFFHELTNKESRPKRVFDVVVASLGLLLLTLLYPFIAIGIKLSSKGPVIRRIKTEGLSGNVFVRYQFRTTHQQEERTSDKQVFLWGRILCALHINKLPGIINILKNEMSIVGPMAYTQTESVYWNNKLDDFYKRYAVKPGLVAIYHLKDANRKLPSVSKQLKKEFKYLGSPHLKNDLKVIFGNF